ncbi:MAG: DUF7450 family protein [Thermodesulfobacteriota bacterium]
MSLVGLICVGEVCTESTPTSTPTPTPTPLLPHFKCYEITPGTALNVPVELNDQFGDEDVTVRSPHHLFTQVLGKCFKDGYYKETPVPEGDFNHLRCYKITRSGPSVVVIRLISVYLVQDWLFDLAQNRLVKGGT